MAFALNTSGQSAANPALSSVAAAQNLRRGRAWTTDSPAALKALADAPMPPMRTDAAAVTMLCTYDMSSRMPCFFGGSTRWDRARSDSAMPESASKKPQGLDRSTTRDRRALRSQLCAAPSTPGMMNSLNTVKM
jgi:hypothetical protein